MTHIKKRSYYPLGLFISGKKCLVVGGGKIAERKIKRLLEYGACVENTSPSITPAIREWVAKGLVRYRCGRFSSRQIKGMVLVFAASNDPKLNQRIVRIAGRKGIFANCAKPGMESSFIVPSLLRRPSFTVSISTDGCSPVLAKKIREQLEGIL